MLLPGLKTASFPPNPILAHWNGLERNGTLEHPTVPAAGAAPPGPPQPSVAAPIDSQRPCGSNPQVAAPSARRLSLAARPDPPAGTLEQAGTLAVPASVPGCKTCNRLKLRLRRFSARSAEAASGLERWNTHYYIF